MRKKGADQNPESRKGAGGGAMRGVRFLTRTAFLILVPMLACKPEKPGMGTGVKETAEFRAQLARLEAEADRIEDAKAVKRLQRAYGYYLDQAMWNEMADLFAPDATMEIALDGVYAGRERIRQYLFTLGGGRAGLKHGQLNDHIQVQPVVHVSGDGLSAKARWRSVIMKGQLGESASWGDGIYENEYVKQSGVWKIRKLHWYQTFMVPYEGGWAKNKDRTDGIYVSKRLPPDQPPTERYEVWPGVYTPPFHHQSIAMVSSDPVKEPDPAVAELARRIRLLRDTEQIGNLVSLYGYYLDKQKWDLLTGLFADDSTLEISQRGIYVGKKSVRRAWELFGPQNIERNHLHNHIQLQPVIHVSPDGQRARVRSRALSELGTYGGNGIWGDSVYENEFVKENGAWKIARDHLYTTFFALYDQGWVAGARPAPKASEKIPPDMPPSEIYGSYPEIYIPAFHYKNPVTGEMPAGQAGPGIEEIPGGVRDAFARISRKVTRLEDENAIENLQRAYGFYVDKALWKEAADLFAPNGTLELGGRGVFAGKPRVLEYLTWLAPGGLTKGKLFNHIQLQPIVHVDPGGHSARGRWRFLVEYADPQKSATWGGGTYENEYVKEGGIWKIKTLHGFFRFYTPYKDGWGKSADPHRPPGRLPADRPPTVVYDLYPSTFVAPFHYRNP